MFKKYTEQEIQSYLLSHAEINSFYVTYFKSSNSGLIHYFDSEGKSWCLMEDDDELVSDAMEFLKNKGIPFLNDMNMIQEFERNWGK